MKKIYKTPETVMIEIDNLSLMAAVSGPTIDPGTAITPGNSEAKPFDFAPLEEQEESTRVSTTNEEEWDDFEEEEI